MSLSVGVDRASGAPQDGSVTGTSLVVLAAGLGTRFGGTKQLVPVRDDGATVTDVLLERAAAAGIAGAVIVVRPEIEDGLRARAHRMEQPGIRVELALQNRPRGTADAVLAARKAIDGAFIVVNADDLYPAVAFSLVARHLRDARSTEHAAVGFRLDRTLVGSRPESRALLTVGRTGTLVGVREGRVEKGSVLRFVTATSVEPLAGDELVSMNMWGFRPSVFDALTAAVLGAGAKTQSTEISLPEVVATMIEQDEAVRVLGCDEPCVGITYPDDVDAVRALL